MTEQGTTQIARGLVEAFNKNDWDAFKAAMKPDAVYDEVGTSRLFTGNADIIAALKEWKKAMPDATGKVTNVFGSGDEVFLEVTWTGTQTGPFAGPSGVFPATGKKQTTRAGWLLNFDKGKVKECRQYFDMLSMMHQLDALPKHAVV